MNLLRRSTSDKPKFFSLPWISLVERNKQTHERLPGLSVKVPKPWLPCAIFKNTFLEQCPHYCWCVTPSVSLMGHFPLLIKMSWDIWTLSFGAATRSHLEQSTIFWLIIPTTSDSNAYLPGVGHCKTRSGDANRTISYVHSTDQARQTSSHTGCTLKSYQKDTVSFDPFCIATPGYKVLQLGRKRGETPSNPASSMELFKLFGVFLFFFVLFPKNSWILSLVHFQDSKVADAQNWHQTLDSRCHNSTWSAGAPNTSRPDQCQESGTTSAKDRRLICSDFTSTPHSMTSSQPTMYLLKVALDKSVCYLPDV